MSESSQSDIDRLSSLQPEARARVESALKAAIEREVAAGRVGGGAAAGGNMFSRGWVFSRITPAARDEGLIMQHPEVAKMSPDQLASFAQRLAQMKGPQQG